MSKQDIDSNMKKIALGILVILLFFFTACKNEPKKNHAKVEKPSHLEEIIAKKVKGIFVITQPDTVKKYWNLNLKSEGIKSELNRFEVVASTPEGSSDVVYMLLARSDDALLFMASLLKLKGNELYFEEQGGYVSYTICKGNCQGACIPIVSLYEKQKVINCSLCSDCVKIQGAFPF